MTRLSLSICFCGVLAFAGWIMYVDLLRQNSNQYFQMYTQERNYQLETERLKEDNHALELRIKELKLVDDKGMVRDGE